MSASSYVVLKGSRATPLAPLLLLLDLERRGFRFRRDGANLVIRPFSQLTGPDVAALKLWKAHALELLDYVPPEVA
jgi:hypothetical protein